jgi:hypothetical protein
MVLESAATIKAIEKRLPASTSESENDCLSSGKAIPKVATIIDGIRLAQGTMQIVQRSLWGGPVLISPVMEVSLLQRNHDVGARLIADNAGDMAAAGRVIRQHYVAWTETFHGAVAGFDLHLSR